MDNDIGHLHHVGHVVNDMSEALTLYRRLGFVLPPPSYPTMAPRQGAAPVPFGAANTHADFPRSFVELATYVKEGHADRIPSDAKLIPLQAPAELMPRLLERIGNTSASLATYLDRFEGLHILLFSHRRHRGAHPADAGAAAAALRRWTHSISGRRSEAPMSGSSRPTWAA